jgi:hypothetical protein
MASSLVVEWTCALESLGFTQGIILKMKVSTWGFSPRFVSWKKKTILDSVVDHCACIYTPIWPNIEAEVVEWRRRSSQTIHKKGERIYSNQYSRREMSSWNNGREQRH